MKPIIKVENIGKQYRIGVRQSSYATLREALTGALGAPFKRARRKGHGEDGTIWALKNVSFEVRPGEVIGIIGRNGAGKSTLLKVLSRITEPTTGRISIHGRIASLLEVGTGFHPELTGRENIYLNGAILGMKRTEIGRRFDEIVAFAEIEKFLDTPVKHYSSGMYMRLAFAVAAHLQPEILLIDEVLAVGDVAFQNKCLGKMGEAAKQGRTVLFVSHQMNAIAQLCPKALLLGHGGITKEGDTQSVIDHYLSETAAGGDRSEFIASAPPADKDVFISKAQSFNSQGEVTSQFTHKEQVIIGLTCVATNLIISNAPLNIGFHVIDKSGRIVFRSETTVALSELRREGKLSLTATIPSNILVPGRYVFSFFIHIPFVKIFDVVENAFAITIIDGGSQFSIYEGKADYGCVFINCEWRVDNSLSLLSDESGKAYTRS